MGYSNGCGCSSGLGSYGRVAYRAPGARTPQRGQLGYIPWGTIIGAGVDLTRSLIDGGGTSCPNQEGPELVAARLDGATPAQQAELVAALRGTNPSWFPAGSTFQQLYGLADQLAFAVAGGSDCKVGTAAGTRLVTAYNALRPVQPSTPPDATVYYPSTGTYQPPVYVPDAGPVLQSSEPTATPDAGTGLLDTIKEAIADAARAAAEAATRSATSSVTQYPAVEQRIREYELERKEGFVQASLPWLLGGGLALALLVGGRRR